MPDQVVAAIIAACAGLIGVILGGGLQWLGAYLNDRRNWRRADARRFEVDRRAAYARLLGSIAAVVNRDDALSGNRIQASDPLVTEWFAAITEVEILATQSVRETASAFSRIVNDTLFNPQSRLPVDAWGNARRHLIQAMRQELGIPDTAAVIQPNHATPGTSPTGEQEAL